MRKVLMPFIMLGDPTEEKTVEVVQAAVRGGADMLELGIPYSDPLADGPVLRQSAQRAIDGGMTAEKAIALIERIRTLVDCPIYVLTYGNLLLTKGAPFLRELEKAGVTGMVVPDIPLEEREGLKREMAGLRLRLPAMVAPTSRGRLPELAQTAEGFVYAVTAKGVTGKHNQLDAALPSMIQQVKQETKTPVYAGFGINGPDRAVEACRHADGVIVGTAFMEAAMEGPGAAETCIRNIRLAIDGMVD